MGQKRAQKLEGLAQPQVWHAGYVTNVSALPEQGEACELVGLARELHAKSLSTCTCKFAYGEHLGYQQYNLKASPLDRLGCRHYSIEDRDTRHAAV